MYGMQSKINQILRGAETIRRNSMTTDTPRTDAEIWDVVYHHKNEIVVDADFARELERELAEAKAEVEQCKRDNGIIITAFALRNDKLKSEVERLKNDFNRLKTLMHQTIWFVDDMIKTHTNGCEYCHKKHGAMITLFKDITEEPQWPIDTTDK